MSYQKFLVDNALCSRRFHLSFDDEQKPRSEVSVPCPHCGATIFSAKNHAPVTLAREENLVKTINMSPNRMSECDMTDKLSYSTVPELKGKTAPPLYPQK